MAKKFSKALPYLVQRDGYPIKEGAFWLRNTLLPLMAKRLPTIYYAGFNQKFIPGFIKKHKGAYPYFVKIDIAKFYPCISHQHLFVETLLSYKKLLGLSSVPSSFRARFESLYVSFINSLSLNEQGLPLNSSMSKSLAPMMYVNFFGIEKK